MAKVPQIDIITRESLDAVSGAQDLVDDLTQNIAKAADESGKMGNKLESGLSNWLGIGNAVNKTNENMKITIENLAKSGALSDDLVKISQGITDGSMDQYEVQSEINKMKSDQASLDSEILVLEQGIAAARQSGDIDLVNQYKAQRQELQGMSKDLEYNIQSAETFASSQDIGKEATDALGGAFSTAGDMLPEMGGLTSGMQDIMKATTPMAAGIIAVTVALKLAVDILKAWSANIDAVGETFGAIGLQSSDIKDTMMSTAAEAKRLGYEMSDVLSTSTQLSDNFSISLSESMSMTGEVLDMSKALGLSTSEGANLVGTLKDMVGLSTEESVALAKNVTLFAKANDVAPQQVLRDIASSSEAVAGFTDKSGENIARAAVQARKLGQSIADVASSAEQLLDFQGSLEKSLTASVMTGKQFNIERLQQLALEGDLEGLQQEQLKLLKETGFAELDNVIAKRAAAEALGLTLEQAQNMVTAQEEGVALAGELAGQPGFDELVGEEALSTLTQMGNALASIGAMIVNVIGPPLNLILVAIQKIMSGIGWVFKLVGMPFKAVGAGVSAVGSAVGLAEGGIVNGPTNAVVGEAGPEAVVPLDKFMSEFRALKSEMSGVKDAIGSLKLKTEISNKQLNVVLTPELGG